jgi:bleomycin hydrolase
MKALISNEPNRLTPSWKNAVKGILNAYLGNIPTEFTHQGKKYTPQTYAQSLGLKMDDYVTITSFTHHPFYSKFILELPDNWYWGEAYNVTIDDLFAIAENAVNKGYTVAWATDVSEKGFSFRDALAIVPKDMSDVVVKGEDNAQFNNAGAIKTSTVFETPVEEINITQELRQLAFDNYETQDDHGMHITGLAKDQNGKKYFVVKNSWGTEHNLLKGYLLASEAYFKYKTTNIMVHKDAIPKDLKKKLGL